MDLLRIYARVLALLGPEARLGWLLGLGNLALAASQFAEPVLFGRIIDTLTGADRTGAPVASTTLAALLAGWVGFGLFTIAAGVTIALHADRLSHRRRHAVLTSYFEHVLQLPQSFHGGAHSGRLMKVMLAGTDALWSLWLDFFRDSFSAAMMVLVILPLSLMLNWRLGLTLLAVAAIFAVLTSLVMAKTDTMQRTVERHLVSTSPSVPPTRSATSHWCRAMRASRRR